MRESRGDVGERGPRYLEWGRRNHTLNELDCSNVHFTKMGAMEYLQYAARHPERRFDLVILDPPTFGAGNSRRKIKTWRAESGYPKLLAAAARVLTPDGLSSRRRTRAGSRRDRPFVR